METKGLLSPEIIAAKAVLDEAREVYSAAQAKVLAQLDVVNALQNTFWETNISKFNLDDPEDLMVVADAGWDNGQGNAVISEHLRNWISSKSKYFLGGSWTGDGSDVILPLITLIVPCSLNDETLALLSETIASLNETFTAINEDYRFGILENSCGEKGSYQLSVISANEACVIRYSYGDDTLFAGSVAACVAFISKQVPYCSCGNHDSDSEDDY